MKYSKESSKVGKKEKLGKFVEKITDLTIESLGSRLNI